jgi:hypothetical protein
MFDFIDKEYFYLKAKASFYNHGYNYRIEREYDLRSKDYILVEGPIKVLLVFIDYNAISVETMLILMSLKDELIGHFYYEINENGDIKTRMTGKSGFLLK